MYDALRADRYGRIRSHAPDEVTERLWHASVFYGPCFEGHITPGLEYVLGQGIEGLRARVLEALGNLQIADPTDRDRLAWYEAALLSCDAVLTYARRYREEALHLARDHRRPAGPMSCARPPSCWPASLRIRRAPSRRPCKRTGSSISWSRWRWAAVCRAADWDWAGWTSICIPYYRRDVAAGRMTREQALEWMELFLLGFRHVDYYTPHQVYTPGSQASLGGVTPTGLDASNELTELIMEASLRIAMPAPYVSLRLHKDAPERYWQAAAAYVIGGLGFPIVNDEVLIPAFMRHGRALGDARDYICSCCYENTIPGREAFHPNGTYLNLPFVLELALNSGRSLLTGESLGLATGRRAFASFDAVLDAFRRQLGFVSDRLVAMVNRADAAHTASRRYPLMSLFIEDCIARGQDVCAGGARYNLTGCIVAGLPNVVNALAAIRHCVFEQHTVTMGDLLAALRANFEGYEHLRRRLLAAPKWGNGDPHVDDLAALSPRRSMPTFRIAATREVGAGRWRSIPLSPTTAWAASSALPRMDASPGSHSHATSTLLGHRSQRADGGAGIAQRH